MAVNLHEGAGKRSDPVRQIVITSYSIHYTKLYEGNTQMKRMIVGILILLASATLYFFWTLPFLV